MGVILVADINKSSLEVKGVMVIGEIFQTNQNPSLLLSLDLSTYSWMCSWSTGSSTTSRVLKETYLDGSKSAGLW